MEALQVFEVRSVLRRFLPGHRLRCSLLPRPPGGIHCVSAGSDTLSHSLSWKFAFRELSLCSSPYANYNVVSWRYRSGGWQGCE